MAAECANVEEPSSKMPGSNQTVTIGTSCTGRLEVTGDSNTIIIPNGVTISGHEDNDRFAIETTDGTNTTIKIESGGAIGATDLDRYGIFHNTGSGSLMEIIIEESAKIEVKETGSSGIGTAIFNKSTIGDINNAGTIKSNTKNAIANGAGGVINKIDNTGTIHSVQRWAIKNITGQIGEIDNSGTIKSDDEVAIRNFGVGEITTITNSGTITSDEQTIQVESGAVIGTINNMAGGTISATQRDGQAIRVDGEGSSIGTINNAGTISTTLNNNSAEGYTIKVKSGGKITTIINSGTISSLGTKTNHGSIWVGDRLGSDSGTISTITNSGDITANSKEGAINNHGTINIINNSGTIENTEDDDDESAGIRNADSGIIGTINNTGTITGASGIDIRNADKDGNVGTIRILNNDQGGGDALTYSHALPTNYNVIVNSASDFGKIVFSEVSGSTIFGISENSTLTGDTTYSSVINGLSSSDFGDGTSGSFITDSTRFNWALSNSSDNLWDLVVDEAVNIEDDTEGSVENGVKPNIVAGINNMASVTNTNFANMNTYDCDLFGKSNFCFSPGGRYQIINTPNVKTSGIVFIGGYKLSDSLRVAGFLHRNFSHKTPKNYKIKDRTPMTGGLLVWNQNPDITGWQVKFASAAQRKTANLTRSVFGTSEEATGQTGIQAQSYVIETQYGYQFNEDVLLKPYLAVRRAMIEQDAYTEQGASTPLSYNEIKDQSTTLLLGLKYDAQLNQKLTLNGSVGVEYDTSHSLNKLTPTGMSGLSTVSLTDGFNDVRPLASIGFDYEVMPNQKLSGTFQYQELAYKSKTESNAYLYYTIGI